jgi:hypothetical protein
MTRLRFYLLQSALILMLVSTSACNKDAAPQPPKSVSKKIPISSAQAVAPAPVAVQKVGVSGSPPEMAEPRSADTLSAAVPWVEGTEKPQNIVLSLEEKPLESLSASTVVVEDIADAQSPTPAVKGAHGIAADGSAADVIAIKADANLTEPSSLIKESLLLMGSYEPDGRINPFAPLFRERPTPKASAPNPLRTGGSQPVESDRSHQGAQR